jgi:hypothetical protein
MAMNQDFTKIVRPGMVELRPDYWRSFYCKIRFESGRLSISGVIDPRRGGHSGGGCGQIDMEFEHRNPAHNDSRYSNRIRPDQIRYAEGWDSEKWLTFLEIWHDWHLNDLRPYCQHQKELGWHQERIDPARPSTDYDKFDGVSHSWNLKIWVYPPLGHLTEPCPVCGYKCGSKWLSEEVPYSAIRFLTDFIPTTDQQPAWV